MSGRIRRSPKGVGEELFYRGTAGSRETSSPPLGAASASRGFVSNQRASGNGGTWPDKDRDCAPAVAKPGLVSASVASAVTAASASACPSAVAALRVHPAAVPGCYGAA